MQIENPNKPYQVTVAFGSDTEEAFGEGNMQAVEENGELHQLGFDTEAEREAFLLGCEMMCGNNGWAHGLGTMEEVAALTTANSDTD